MEGFAYLSGRKKDEIIRGGEDTYPVEVESVFLRIYDVMAAAVVCMPDEDCGELAVADLIVDRTGYRDEQLGEHASERLAQIKVRAVPVMRNALPMHSIGKMDTGELRPRLILPSWGTRIHG